jgi:SulP family sulfate permease
MIFGILKVGHCLDHISPVIIRGFTSAAAIIIIINQLKSILGTSMSHYQNLIHYMIEIFYKLPQTNVYSVGIGLFSLFFLFFLKKHFTVSPGPFLVIILSTAAVNLWALDHKGVAVLGRVPKGFPELTLVIPSVHIVQILLPTAFAIAVISFFESYAVAKLISEKENYDINPNKEFCGLGLANITSSLLGSIPVAGAISRTAVNYRSGARTKLSSFVTVLILLITILFFTPWLYYLPKAALAAIIIIAVLDLIELKGFAAMTKKNHLKDLFCLLHFYQPYSSVFSTVWLSE